MRSCPQGSAICDHLVEQLTPTSTWGRRFVTTPLAARQNGDTFRILAASNDTEVRIHGVLIATLDAGQFRELILTEASVIEASSPVLVAQFANGSALSGNPGDPFMMLIPPYEQFMNSYTVTTPASGFAQSYVSVVAQGSGTISLDGSIVPPASFAPIGASGYFGATIPVAPGTHRLSAAQPFGLAIYGFNKDESYGYTGGLSLSQIARVLRVELTPADANAITRTSTCVTGTAIDANSGPVSGVRMDFAVTGVHPTTAFAVTDTAGAAEFCYTGTIAGLDTIIGTVSDISDTATRTWRDELPVNRAPTADAQTVSTNQGFALTVTLTGSDPDGDVLTFAATQPGHGTLTGSGASRVYTPAATYTGPDSFTFTASDGTVTSPPATVTITVTAVNRAPTANAQTVSTNQGVALTVTLTGSDPDGDVLTFAATQPGHGTLTGSGASRVYTPAATYTGPDSFTFTASDGTVTSPPATVTITVTAVNRAPTADAQTVSTNQGVALTVTLTGSDPDGGVLTFAATQPGHGTLTGSGASRVYTPAATYAGPDSFTFTVSDGTVTSPPATVTITVTPVLVSANQLMVSNDAGRKVAVRGLDGQVFRNGAPIYAFVGPRSRLQNITKVTFWIDDPTRTAAKAFSVEDLADFDLARTASNGTAYPLESNLLTVGTHVITAKIEYSTRPALVLSATITISDTKVHRLQVSTRSDRTQAVDLAGATLRGDRYIFLGLKGDSISGAREVVFLIDGKQVRRDAVADYDLVGSRSDGKALALDTRKLKNSKHELVAVVYLSGEDVAVVYRASFTVNN